MLGGDKAELKQETPLSAGDLEKELKSVNADIAQDAENPKLYLHKALLIYQTGPSGYIESIKNFEKARDLGSLDPRIFYYLGTLYQYEGLYDYSAKEYLRFLNNYPKDKEVRMLLGKLYFKNGDDDMESVGSNKDVNLVVQFGRLGNSYSSDNWSGARRYLLEKDSDPNHITSPVLWQADKVDMGDYRSVIDFAQWTAAKFPAKRYFFIWTNHAPVA